MSTSASPLSRLHADRRGHPRHDSSAEKLGPDSDSAAFQGVVRKIRDHAHDFAPGLCAAGAGGAARRPTRPRHVRPATADRADAEPYDRILGRDAGQRQVALFEAAAVRADCARRPAALKFLGEGRRLSDRALASGRRRPHRSSRKCRSRSPLCPGLERFDLATQISV